MIIANRDFSTAYVTKPAYTAKKLLILRSTYYEIIFNMVNLQVFRWNFEFLVVVACFYHQLTGFLVKE